MRGDRPYIGAQGFFAILFTPHARGSTTECVGMGISEIVYPACAGIDLFTAIMQRMACCLPRMRGDRPQPVCFSQDRIPFTPHARGSTSAKAAHALPRRVYPACAGIDLRDLTIGKYKRSLPRMRGDRPHNWKCKQEEQKFTPHARGSTGIIRVTLCYSLVYPACAGIDRLCRNLWATLIRLPRMRGDRPPTVVVGLCTLGFTPHARGSTACRGSQPPRVGVYPACAGIDRLLSWRARMAPRLPRMRGDRPKPALI